jgi:hypothetical protein
MFVDREDSALLHQLSHFVTAREKDSGPSRPEACTAKNQYRKFETNIPRKGIARPQSQFPHSCVYERLICSHGRSAYSAAGNIWTDIWEYINRSQTHELGLRPRNSQKRNTYMGFSLQCGYIFVICEGEV